MSTISSDRLSASLGDRYRIERELGQGGMATVYLAQDLKHDRRVAIKVLKPELAAVLGAERFVQEIKTTAALSHPHILPLFDSGRTDGQTDGRTEYLFYVMPYVEGETLRDKLNRDRQFGIAEAVRIATEVADALDYAHRHGVIHRDIKPENILLHDGRPMVMDFGIALAVSAAAGGRMTETGLSLGTPHYMSPEQATADRDITGRSDIYSLASVLYEMLSGEPPHMGTSAQQIIMKIIAEPVKPVTELRKSVPPNVTAAVAKALEKLPADRFDSAKQFAEALANLAFTTVTSGAGGPAAARSRSPRVLVGALGLAAVVATALAVWGLFRPAPSQPVTRFLVSVPDDLPISILRNGSIGFDISRDASRFAYIGSARGEAPRVFVRHVGSFDVLPVAGSENAEGFALSPDGREVVVKVGHEIWRTGWSGEEPRIVADSAQYGPLWADDGFIYFTALSGDLVRAPAGGGRRERVVAAIDRGALTWTDILPDGRGGLYTASRPIVEGGEPAIRVADFTNDSTKELGPGQFALYRSGRLLITRTDGSVWAAPFDLKRLAATQDLIAVARHQAISTTDTWQGMAVSATGTLVYGSAPGRGHSPVRVRRDGRETPYPFAAPFNLGPRLSPEGGRLVSTMAEGTASDISVVNLADGTTTRLTFDGASAYPDWLPDGKRVAWYTIVNGAYELRWRAADASSPTVPLMRGPSRPIEVVFLPGGRAFIAREGDRSSSENAELIRYDMVGDSLVRTPLTNTPANERSPLVSPDGRYVAYVSDESGVDQVYVRETRPSENVWPVSREGGLEPLWSRSGRELFFRNRGRLVRVGVRTVPAFAVTEAAQDMFPVAEYALNMNHTSYGILPGDEEFVFIKVTTPLNRLVMVTNWMDEVNALLEGGR